MLIKKNYSTSVVYALKIMLVHPERMYQWVTRSLHCCGLSTLTHYVLLNTELVLLIDDSSPASPTELEVTGGFISLIITVSCNRVIESKTKCINIVE